MKYISVILICLIAFTSCNSEGKKSTVEEINELTIAQKIANAHGFENWNKVTEVRFTFRVDRDTIKGNGRSWIWNPKINDVNMVMGSAVVSYNRHKVDSTHMGADRAFTNDKYWFLVPFQLVWDKTASISEPVKKESPLGKEKLSMITITYPAEGGYTPGDAYDIFYDENFLIKEWSYRPKNSDKPYMSTTFENYQDFNGIKVAINHKKDDGKWNLNFTDVSITLE